MTSELYATVDFLQCILCGECSKICPNGAILIWHGLITVINETYCKGCGKCECICPSNCIKLEQRVSI